LGVRRTKFFVIFVSLVYTFGAAKIELSQTLSSRNTSMSLVTNRSEGCKNRVFF
jgi:hypothetical protein